MKIETISHVCHAASETAEPGAKIKPDNTPNP